MEIAKAIHFIKNKEIEKAIESFKGFEKKDKIMMAMASNITYVSFILEYHKTLKLKTIKFTGFFLL